jgi:DUF4097 and DUF4098 domain-containing protein YvlB
MRLRSTAFSVALLLSVTLPAAHAAQDKRHDDLPERDEKRMTVELAPGATVEILDISGSVDVRTGASGPARIEIVRSARTREDLERRHIDVEQTAGGLLVRGRQERMGMGWGNHEVRQRVTLEVPSDVSLRVSDISGRVSAGDLNGSLQVSDVSGQVKVGRVGGACTVRDVSGGVEVTVTHVADAGVRVNDVSGSVDVYFAGDVNANLTVRDVSGKVSVDLPGAKIQGKIDPDNYSATLGAGGPPVEVMDVSGRVRLAPAGER